jgi:hypothetical protein
MEMPEMEAATVFEMLATLYWNRLHHIPEDSVFQNQMCLIIHLTMSQHDICLVIPHIVTL